MQDQLPSVTLNMFYSLMYALGYWELWQGLYFVVVFAQLSAQLDLIDSFQVDRECGNADFKARFGEREEIFYLLPFHCESWNCLIHEAHIGKPDDIVAQIVHERATGRDYFEEFQVPGQL